MSIQQNFSAISPSLNLNFARSKTLDPRITFSRTTTATRVNEQGLVEVVSADIPRFDHKYDASTGVIKSLGLLVEEQRSNLTKYSNTLQTFQPINGTITTNQTTSPSGENNASLLTQTAATTCYVNYGSGQITWTSGQQYTFSCFVKKYSNSDENQIYILGYGLTFNSDPSGANSVVIFNLDTLTSTTAAGLVNSHSIDDVGNGWRRISATFTAYTTESRSHQVLRFVDPGATSNMYVWGYQIEEGAFPTSYIPRPDDSTATRNPDTVTMTGDNFSDWYNQEQGSIVWIGRVYTKEDPGLCAFRINRTDGGNLRGMAMQIDTRYSNNNNTINFMSRTQSSNIPSKIASVGIVTSTSTIKLAGGYIESVGLSTIRAAFNGDPENSYSGSSQTDVVDGAMNELEIMGERGTSGANYYFTGVCEQLVYYPRILTDAQLQSLTK
jgi:hypothetical protein